jgi:hypothetical protein
VSPRVPLTGACPAVPPVLATRARTLCRPSLAGSLRPAILQRRWPRRNPAARPTAHGAGVSMAKGPGDPAGRLRARLAARSSATCGLEVSPQPPGPHEGPSGGAAPRPRLPSVAAGTVREAVRPLRARLARGASPAPAATGSQERWRRRGVGEAIVGVGVDTAGGGCPRAAYVPAAGPFRLESGGYPAPQADLCIRSDSSQTLLRGHVTQ